MKVHLETVDVRKNRISSISTRHYLFQQLRAECVELRRGEAHLRNQIDSLIHLMNIPTRNPGVCLVTIHFHNHYLLLHSYHLQLVHQPKFVFHFFLKSFTSTSLIVQIIDPIEDARQIEVGNRLCSSLKPFFVEQDVQTAVVQITLQLQSDAENVSGLTNRVAQIIRDRDEVKTIQFSHESVYI